MIRIIRQANIRDLEPAVRAKGPRPHPEHPECVEATALEQTSEERRALETRPPSRKPRCKATELVSGTKHERGIRFAGLHARCRPPHQHSNRRVRTSAAEVELCESGVEKEPKIG